MRESRRNLFGRLRLLALACLPAAWFMRPNARARTVDQSDFVPLKLAERQSPAADALDEGDVALVKQLRELTGGGRLTAHPFLECGDDGEIQKTNQVLLGFQTPEPIEVPLPKWNEGRPSESA